MHKVIEGTITEIGEQNKFLNVRLPNGKVLHENYFHKRDRDKVSQLQKGDTVLVETDPTNLVVKEFQGKTNHILLG